MKRNYLVVGLVFLIFFVISLLTNPLTALIPDIIASFKLSLGMAGLLPFAFFIAYGVMSIPSGMLIERYQEKAVITAAFGIALVGLLAFSLLPGFRVALPSFFLVGIGMAMLQVAVNPLLRTAGGEEHFAFNSVAAQFVFGLASAISPKLFSYLVSRLADGAPGGNLLIATLARIVPPDLPWISLYWVFALVSLLMVLLMLAVRLPRVELKEDERPGAWATHLALLKDRHVLLYFLGIFCYVGTEQGVSNWISKFLQTYHGIDPRTQGADAGSNFWLLMTFGCLLGLVLLKFWDSRKVLIGAAVAAILTLTLALFGPTPVAIRAFPAMGFCASVMWSIIFSLALNSVAKHHGSLSGILCTAITGGALVPFIIGSLGDVFGLRAGMLFLYLTLGYVLSIGFWARPLINNATISSKKKSGAAEAAA